MLMGKENCPMYKLSSSVEDAKLRPIKGEVSQPTTRIGDEFPNGRQMSVDTTTVVSLLKDKFSICFFMNIISWNYRGASSKKFFRHLSDLLSTHRLDILFLLETKVKTNKTQSVLRMGGFDGFFAAEARGFAGGSTFKRAKLDWIGPAASSPVLNAPVRFGLGSFLTS